MKCSREKCSQGRSLRIAVSVRGRGLGADDMLDALVVALVARAAAIGRREPIPMGDHELAQREGWVALPQRESLNEIA